MASDLIATFIILLLLQQSDKASAGCIYEIEGLNSSITIFSDVMKGMVIYQFNITQNGSSSDMTADMTSSTTLFSSENNSVFVNECPPAGRSLILEFVITTASSCDPGYLYISVQAAKPMFNMCTNAEVSFTVVDGYLHVMELNLLNNHRCASFGCSAACMNCKELFIIYHWIIKTNASNPVIFEKVYKFVVACWESSQTEADRESLYINVRFTNTSLSMCYNFSTSLSTSLAPTTTVFLPSLYSHNNKTNSPYQTRDFSTITLQNGTTTKPSASMMAHIPSETSSDPFNVIATVTASSIISHVSSETSTLTFDDITTVATAGFDCCNQSHEGGFGVFLGNTKLVATVLVSSVVALGLVVIGIYYFSAYKGCIRYRKLW